MAYTTINKSTDYFNTVLWTGNSGSQTISGYGFQPSFLWTKVRNTADSHQLRDSVRTINKTIRSNSSAIEGTVTSAGAFNADGFTTVGTDGNEFNYNSDTYVSWGWKAGTTSGLSGGTITPSSYSFNATSGFSIVKYTGNGSDGATVGHGLGVSPNVVFVKRLSGGTGGWRVYHSSIHASSGETNTLTLNDTDANASDIDNISGVSATTFTTRGTGATNASGSDFIAYCFAEKTGFSKFGSYTGNGSSSSPPFIYTGFKPKFVIVKVTNVADSWFIHDDKRDGYNDDNEYLFADLTNAEGTNTNRIRLLSNGFSVPTTDKSHNVSGNSYIYMAFGQSLVGSNNVPATAR